ncbi:unnamed protein product [Schistosoma haematobium]|nr:unnamed protein product [Schistosoma haematobium]CAH8670125.1 unnamed protein product [Schistosoma haematobium]
MTLFRNDRKIGIGGGVAIYISSCLEVHQVHNLEFNNLEESIWCSVRLSSTSRCLVGVIYRKPTADTEYDSRMLEGLSRSIRLGFTHILILGDFNLPRVNFAEHTYTGGDNSTEARFFNLIDNLGLYENVRSATRWRNSQTPSRLDCVFTNEEFLVDNLSILAPLGKSDHAVIAFSFVIKTKLRYPNNNLRWNFKRLNVRALHDHLQQVAWDVHPQIDVDGHWDFLLHTLLRATNHSVPQTVPKSFKPPTVIKNRTLRLLSRKRHCWAEYKRTNNDGAYRQYKHIRNTCTKAIREDRLQYQTKLMDKFASNPRSLFRYAASLRQAKTGVSQLLGPNGPTNNDGDAANLLAAHYSQTFQPADINFIDDSFICNSTGLSEVDLSADLVFRKLQHLRLDTSPGPDMVHPAILREAASILATPLSVMFSHSLSRGKLPENWKLAHITPIFKGGRRNEPSSYRPVALLSLPSKLMESLICDGLNDYLLSLNFFSPQQHGFRKGYSCITNLLTAVDRWTSILDRKGKVDVIYLDFSKAFDKVNHLCLINKLKRLGIKPPLIDWLTSYLKNRHFKVRVNFTLSQAMECSSGVPQGSVLGPLLFLIYINDLPQQVTSDLLLFADDVKLWREIRNQDDIQALQEDLTRLHSWADDNGLTFNTSKCKVVHLRHVANYSYNLGNSSLVVSQVEKDLGVLVPHDLKSYANCDKNAFRANLALVTLRRIFGQFDGRTFHTIFNSFIRPHLEYGNIVLPPSLQKDKVTLERIQRRATKSVRGLKSKPYEERLRSLDLYPLEYRRLRGDLLMAYSILNTSGHPLKHLLKLSSNNNLRGNTQKLETQHSKTECRHNFYSLRVVKSWNSLPAELVQATSQESFKRQLDLFLRTKDSIAL